MNSSEFWQKQAGFKIFSLTVNGYDVQSVWAKILNYITVGM